MTLDFPFYLSFSYYADQIEWMQDVLSKEKNKKKRKSSRGSHYVPDLLGNVIWWNFITNQINWNSINICQIYSNKQYLIGMIQKHQIAGENMRFYWVNFDSEFVWESSVSSMFTWANWFAFVVVIQHKSVMIPKHVIFRMFSIEF